MAAGYIQYNTLIIGGSQQAVDIYQEIAGLRKGLAYKFLGFLRSNGQDTSQMDQYLPCLGGTSDIATIIPEKDIEEVIVAIETSEHNKLKKILDDLFDFEDKVLVKIIPDMYDIMLGSVKMNYLYGAV